MEAIIKILKTFQAYCPYIGLALVGIYSYYTSPFPFLHINGKPDSGL